MEYLKNIVNNQKYLKMLGAIYGWRTLSTLIPGTIFLLNKNIHYLFTIGGGLVEGFLKEDSTRDVIA